MINLAIPNKGRISTDIRKLLEKIGLEIPENGRKLYANTSNPNIGIVYARAADIPFYVQAGAADLGITGEDMIRESGTAPVKLLRLNFGGCRIAVAVLQNSRIRSPRDYRNGIRVATKLVATAHAYFSARKIKADILRMAGATELAPTLGIADLIVDQVSTGTTLAANNLREVDTICNSGLYLVSNALSLKKNPVEIDELKVAMESVLTAESKRYVMANVAGEGVLRKVVQTMPSMESPTVLSLAKPGEYAIQSVVDSSALIATIRRLKQAGAKDILVMNMSRVVE